MTAYIIVEAVLHDPEKFGAYAKVVPDIVAEFGGEYLVLGGEQTPEDIGHLAVFYASAEARMITGQVIAVDGGISLQRA